MQLLFVILFSFENVMTFILNDRRFGLNIYFYLLYLFLYFYGYICFHGKEECLLEREILGKRLRSKFTFFQDLIESLSKNFNLSKLVSILSVSSFKSNNSYNSFLSMTNVFFKLCIRSFFVFIDNIY